MYIDAINSPLGTVEIHASETGTTFVNFVDKSPETLNGNVHTQQCAQQLREYFAGSRQTFNLQLDQQGTAFQKSVWLQLLTIPFGQSASYLDIANTIDNPKAVRAVGAANGKNPIAIIVPCHRIIGSNGTLTGYAGGLERKEWLLQHEGIRFKAGTKSMQPELPLS